MLARRPFFSFSGLAKGAVTAALAVVLVACSSGGGLYGPIQGDNRPHSGVDRARGMPIQGIDVARYQENVDFRTAFASGIHFVFMKATEGKDYLDPNFRTNWVRARDAGMQVVYQGIRLTPEEIVDAAREQNAHVIGLSVLSGSHLPLVADVVARMKAAGMTTPLVVGGIIPPEDAATLEKSGVAAVYTPKDFELNRIMSDVVRIVERKHELTNA